MRRLGFALLFCGLLACSFVATRVKDHADISWLQMLPAAVVALAGTFLLRATATGAGAATAAASGGLAGARRGLEGLTTKLDQFLAGSQDDPYAVRHWIDAELMDDLSAFVEARDSITERHGLDGYAQVMTEFAGGERCLNRAWCASADGYIDEVALSLGRARAHLVAARDTLTALG